MKLHDNGVADFLDISEVAIADGLVAWYPLNGDAKDHTINRNDGTVNGATVAAGVDGKLCYSFDGANDYISLNDSLRLLRASEPFVISAWVKWKGPTANYYQRVVELATDTYANGFSIVLGTVENYDGIYFGGSGIIDAQKLNFYPRINEWDHLLLVYDGNGMTSTNSYKFYYNSELKLTTTGRSYSTSSLINRFGRRGTTDSFLNADLSDIRIYNRALEEDEIKILYDMTGPSLTTMKQSNNTVYLKGEIQETL